MNIKDRLRYEAVYEYDTNQWWIDITDIFQKLIGDIVIKVEVCDSYGYTEEKAIEATKKLVEDFNKCIDEKKDYCFGWNNLLFTFVNGKTLELESVEELWVHL